MAKIFIDAGHGGHDPGAIGSRSREKDNVLKVANRLKVLLENHGHTVRLSRSTDVFVTLSERARLANVWGAEYFLSLHNNAATASATGFETFIHNGPVQSKTAGFQNAIHAAIIKEIGIRDRGKKRANFAVLRETRMPAVLIEYAFISNASDEKILINEVEKLSQLTANGIVNYVGSNKLLSEEVEQVSSSRVYDLRYGDKGDRVRALQTSLNKIGYRLVVDGSFGPAVESAVKSFQRKYKLHSDGIYGPASQAKLAEVLKVALNSTPSKGDVYRVIVNGKQTGAFGEPSNVATAVRQAVEKKAKKIEIEKV